MSKGVKRCQSVECVCARPIFFWFFSHPDKEFHTNKSPLSLPLYSMKEDRVAGLKRDFYYLRYPSRHACARHTSLDPSVASFSVRPRRRASMDDACKTNTLKNKPRPRRDNKKELRPSGEKTFLNNP